MKIFQLHPTLLCHQGCAWCPYLGMHEDKEIPLAEIQKQLWRYHSTCDICLSVGLVNASTDRGIADVLSIFQPIPKVMENGQKEYKGQNILKLSGGGSPILYSDFDALLFLAQQLGYKIYLQTENTPLLNDFVRGYCYDIRVSFGDGVPFLPPAIPVDGFSYVVSRSPDYENLNALIDYALEHNQYVRVTQDDTDLANIPTIKEIKANVDVDLNTIHAGTSEANRLTGLGFNLRFWDALDYHPGKNPCPCYDSPLLTPLGWFPCCKTHVAKGVVAGYNQTMALGEEYPQTPYDGSECSRCYY